MTIHDIYIVLLYSADVIYTLYVQAIYTYVLYLPQNSIPLVSTYVCIFRQLHLYAVSVR